VERKRSQGESLPGVEGTEDAALFFTPRGAAEEEEHDYEIKSDLIVAALQHNPAKAIGGDHPLPGTVRGRDRSRPLFESDSEQSGLNPLSQEGQLSFSPIPLMSGARPYSPTF